MAPVTTNNAGKAAQAYDNALAYLQDVVEMPTFYTRNLQDVAWVAVHVPATLTQAPVQRALEWGTDIVTATPDTIGVKFTSTKPGPNLHALFVFVTGMPAGNACDHARCEGIFGACIIPQVAHRPHLRESLRTTCAGCMFNYQNTRCRFYVRPQ